MGSLGAVASTMLHAAGCRSEDHGQVVGPQDAGAPELLEHLIDSLEVELSAEELTSTRPSTPIALSSVGDPAEAVLAQMRKIS